MPKLLFIIVAYQNGTNTMREEMENTAERFTTQNIQDDKVMSDILKVVCEEYEGSGIAYDDKVALAGRLYDHVFVECGSLNEVFLYCNGV